MSLTPTQRQLRAQLGGLSSAEKPLEERRENTSAARAAFEARFVREIVTEALARGEQLDDKEIARRADLRRRAYYSRMRLDALRAARERRQAAMDEAS
ncbi:hypothetical protein [Candidatus Nephthysia bennettiae]|uniref:Uncharacterized protein n=1 Tax=Candidatus Nephthysia bennettiae TaxID=3127016 RepID=A0A934K386_9BACT|nr:hypothetical protein [Candidatus Dormibacteraeota bacterium]